MNTKSVYKEVGLTSSEILPKNATKRNTEETKKSRKKSPVATNHPWSNKKTPKARIQATGNGYWSRPGWYISVKEASKTITILIFKDKLTEAIREMKEQNPNKRIVRIERHHGDSK